MKIPVALVDDHRLFVESLSTTIDKYGTFEVIIYATSGEELLKKLETASALPDILLLDVSMKEMDGVATAKLVQERYPLIRMAALSTNDDDYTIIRMIKAGCCAYLVKSVSAAELKIALEEIHEQGYYNGDAVNVNHRRLLTYKEIALTEKERIFVQLACSDLTYKQIAAKMHLSERTIDGYREQVFVKMQVQSRVGMVLEAIKRRVFTL